LKFATSRKKDKMGFLTQIDKLRVSLEVKPSIKKYDKTHNYYSGYGDGINCTSKTPA
jgi:hypothetical protein